MSEMDISNSVAGSLGDERRRSAEDSIVSPFNRLNENGTSGQNEESSGSIPSSSSRPLPASIAGEGLLMSGRSLSTTMPPSDSGRFLLNHTNSTGQLLMHGSTHSGTPSGSTLSVGQSKKWVKLNVGGKIFETTRSTLMREPGSFLHRLCQDDNALPTDRDDIGAYMIDRDPDYFGPVLNYLRHGKLIINPGIREEGILEEAEFYNLPHLAHLIIERIQEREKLKKELGRTKFVYRVLQCHEEELTSVVSGITDGWKIVQVMPIHSNYAAYSGADQPQEYLCIVVRECADNGSMSDSTDRANLLQQKARHN